MAYLRRPDPVEVAHWIQANNLLRTPPFRVAAFALYSSRLLPDGSVYEVEREYGLG